MFIPTDPKRRSSWIKYEIDKMFYLYHHIAYLCLFIFPLIILFLWVLEIDPVFICLNATLLDMRTGFLMPSLIFFLYWFVTIGCVYQVVESTFQVVVPVCTLTFWLTAHYPSPGEKFMLKKI